MKVDIKTEPGQNQFKLSKIIFMNLKLNNCITENSQHVPVFVASKLNVISLGPYEEFHSNNDNNHLRFLNWKNENIIISNLCL